VIKTRQVEHTFNEKNILFAMDNLFIVKLFEYFADSKALYFMLEFINGGEMFTHIQKQKRRRFNEAQTRFFASETVLAFEYLHNLDIIFRDLKPENMLIDSQGHIRLTDFGFAKRVDDKTYTMCGTPEYLAPEIIVNKGYNHAVDWWAVGVLIYEMRCGRSPFEARSQLEMFKKISRRDYKYPRDFTDDEQDLIGNLLQVDLTRRLGNMFKGPKEIKEHKYFKDINWEATYARSVVSPYVPSVSGPNDTSQFDSYPEEPTNWVPGKDAHEDIFNGF
jgi:protein kinase A